MQDEGSSSKGSVQAQQWCKPPPCWIKINTDASCRVGHNFTSAGCVVRDEEGGFMRARACRLTGGGQPREGEARSFREALLWV